MRTHYNKMSLRLLLMTMVIAAVSCLPAWAVAGEGAVKVTYNLSNVTCDSPTAATPGEDFTFQLINKGPEEISMTSLRIEIGGMGTKEYTSSPDQWGKFTIFGEAITADISIYATGYISYEEGAIIYYLDKDNKQGKTESFDRTMASVEIPQSVTKEGVSYAINTLGYQTFINASNLTSVTIPASIKYFEGQIFQGCTNLKEIHLLRTDSIGMFLPPDGSAFTGMDKDKCTIYVPKGSLAAFKGWGGFTEIREEGSPVVKRFTITRSDFFSVAYYGPDLVDEGQRLEARLTPERGYVLGVGDITVTMNGKKLDPGSKEFFYGTFGEETLTIETVTGDVTITAKARKIGGDPFAFGDFTYRITGDAAVEVAGVKEDAYTKGRSYVIPSSLEYEGNYYAVSGIGLKAFEGRIMESITIPSSVETVGTESFVNAQADEIHIQRSTPPATVNGSFNILDKNRCRVYVPKGALSAYHDATWDWLGFPYIMEEGDKYFDVSFELKGLTVKTFQPEIVIPGRNLSFTLVADSGSLLPDSILVWLGEKKVGPEGYTYDAKTGDAIIAVTSDNLTIKAEAIGALVPGADAEITIGKDSTYTAGSTTDGKFNGIIGSDEKQTEIKSLKIETEEGKVTGITLKSLVVSPGSNAGVTISAKSEIEITLDGDNELGNLLNQGITRLLAGVKTSLSVKVENEGTFIDETGLLNAIAGSAALAISRRPEEALEIEAGSSIVLKVDVSTTEGANLSYIWEKFNSDENTWDQVKPEKVPEARALYALRSDVVSADEDAQLEVSEAGQYRCQVSNKVGDVISTLTAYSEVSVASSSTDPVITYNVTLPSVDGIVLTPAAGSYSVEEGASFSFSFTLEADYDQSTPIVKVGDKTIEPASDGKYEIKNINSDITISITGIVRNTTVGNAEVDSDALRVWGSNGVLHIRSAHTCIAYIVTFGGQLYKAVTLPVGETLITIPQGSYIINIGEQSYKIRF